MLYVVGQNKNGVIFSGPNFIHSRAELMTTDYHLVKWSHLFGIWKRKTHIQSPAWLLDFKRTKFQKSPKKLSLNVNGRHLSHIFFRFFFPLLYKFWIFPFINFNFLLNKFSKLHVFHNIILRAWWYFPSYPPTFFSYFLLTFCNNITFDFLYNHRLNSLPNKEFN